MSATILLSVMAASMAVPQSSSSFADAALALHDTDGIAVVRLFVAPDRKVEDCRVLSHDVPDADKDRVCADLIGKRASKPASGPDGMAAYGTMTYLVADSGVVSKTDENSLPLDFVLDVQSLPGGARSKAVSVNVMLDQAGKVTHCEGSNVSDGYTKAACASLQEQALEARRSRDGQPVPYVENITVAFRSRQASL